MHLIRTSVLVVFQGLKPRLHTGHAHTRGHLAPPENPLEPKSALWRANVPSRVKIYPLEGLSIFRSSKTAPSRGFYVKQNQNVFKRCPLEAHFGVEVPSRVLRLRTSPSRVTIFPVEGFTAFCPGKQTPLELLHEKKTLHICLISLLDSRGVPEVKVPSRVLFSPVHPLECETSVMYSRGTMTTTL